MRERRPELPGHAISTPIVQSATFTFASTDDLAAFKEGRSGARDEYARYGNPTTRALEERMAALEGTDDAAAFASGMAAMTTAILAFVSAGDHVVLFGDAYHGTRKFVGSLGRFGVTHSIVAPGGAGLDALPSSLQARTRLVVAESPSNPYGTCVDLARLAATVKAHGARAKTLVDATFATPLLCKPASYGIDLVVHSATKYIAGHNDVLAGIVAGPSHLVSLVRQSRDLVGGVLDPHAAFLVLRGEKTLALRIARQSATALAVARALEASRKVKAGHYPGLPSHPDHAVAAAQMSSGFGGVVAFVVEGGQAAARAFCDATRLALIAPSLGGTETLVEPVALMSYAGMDDEALAERGIDPGLVRIAVGLEDEADVVADVIGALEASG